VISGGWSAGAIALRAALVVSVTSVLAVIFLRGRRAKGE
jgi:hypothetical protein